MKKIIFSSIFFLVGLFPMLSLAKENPNEVIFVALTVGADSCGEYLSKSKELGYGYEIVVDSWITGFFSAISYTNFELKMGDHRLNDMSRYKDHESRVYWLKKYCQDHPLSSVMKRAV